MKNEYNPFSDFMDKCENKKAFAKQIGITRQRLHRWRSSGVPLEKISQISEITGISEVNLVIETYTKRYGKQS